MRKWNQAMMGTMEMHMSCRTVFFMSFLSNE